MPGRPRNRFEGWPPRDRTGSAEWWRPNGITMFRAFPWLVKAFDRVVPETHWSTVTDPETEETAVLVRCTCGVTCWTGIAEVRECACGRFFVAVGPELRCYRPEVTADELLEAEGVAES